MNRDFEVLSIQFDMVEEENKRLRKRIKYLEGKCDYYEELIANHMPLEDVKYGEYDDK